ncbi:MAG: 2-hydroxyacid dehydrogenase [Rhodobacteraceae bacterium]|nr:2-hydroxyacid dehydrogenase [Paracoccaceae bacterium]
MPAGIVVHHPIRHLERLAGLGTLLRYDLDGDPAPGREAEVLVTGGERPLGRAELDLFPRLRLVATMSVGTDAIDLDHCRARGIAVTNTPGVLTEDVADAALMLALAARRGLIAGHDLVRSGRWAAEGPLPLMPTMTGARVGILGMGRIGQAIARRMQALGAEPGYHARSERPGLGMPFFADPVALADWAEILVVAVPGGGQTRGLVSAAVIAALGPEGTLVNVARGSVVDEAALVAALREGRLHSAGLDVFLNEPAPDAALTGLPNVVLYPHHGSGTVRARDAMADLVFRNVAAFLAGRPLVTPLW